MPPAGAVSVPRIVWDVSEQGESLLTALFPHLAGLRVHRVEDIVHAVVISCHAGPAGHAARGAARSQRECMAGIRG
jgi:hypothetical protein